MLSAQQVIRQVETAQHIQTRARNADGCNRVVVHSTVVALTVVIMPCIAGKREVSDHAKYCLAKSHVIMSPVCPC